MLTKTAYIQRTGDVLVDSLLSSQGWNVSSLTFSFPGYGSIWSTSNLTGYKSEVTVGEPWQSGFMPLSSAQKTAFRTILDTWSQAVDLQFVEIVESSSFQGTIRIAFTSSDEMKDTEAWAYFPSATWFGGDIWMSREGNAASSAWEPGSYAYFAVLHELGHTLGLKHPFEEKDRLPTKLDTHSFTVMSYSSLEGDPESILSFYPTTPMILDVLAVQHIYGANPLTNAGNTVFLFDDARPYHQTLVDASGNDTLKYTGFYDSFFDLRPGYDSLIGLPVFASNADGSNTREISNVWIAFDTDIENLVGGAGNDFVIGNDLNNHLDGGAGLDTLIIFENSSAYQIARIGKDWGVSSIANPLHQDTLHSIERIEFLDRNSALDLAPGEAGNRALQIISTIATDFINDPGVAGWVLSRVDIGFSSQAIFEEILDTGVLASLAGGSSDAALVWLAGKNILGAQMSSGVADSVLPFLSEQGGAFSQAEFLALASELPENSERIPLMGIYDEGLAYLL